MCKRTKRMIAGIVEDVIVVFIILWFMWGIASWGEVIYSHDHDSYEISRANFFNVMIDVGDAIHGEIKEGC